MERFCDQTTNFSLPKKCKIVVMPNHKIPGNLYATDSVIKQYADMNGVSVDGYVEMIRLRIGRYVDMRKLRAGRDVFMRELRVGENAEMGEIITGGNFDINELMVGRNIDASGLTAGRDFDISELKAGGSVYLKKLIVGGCVNISELRAGKTLDIESSIINQLYLSTAKGIIIPRIILDEAEIKDFVYTDPILVREFSIRDAKIPKSLEDALNKGVELAKSA